MPSSSRRFRWALLALVAVGVVMRLTFVATVHYPEERRGDTAFFRERAASLVAGTGYTKTDDAGSLQPTASHPPAFPVLLYLTDRSRLAAVDDLQGQRMAVAVLSSLAVAGVGLLGRRLLDPATGLMAAAIAALHPVWIQPAGFLMSESLYHVVVVATALAAVAAVDRPGPARAAVAGVAIALATLTRSEAVLLVILIGAPVVLAAKGRRQRVRVAAALLVAMALVTGPWLLRNRQGLGAATVSTNAGITLAGSNCDDTYAGERMGGFSLDCAVAAAFLTRPVATAARRIGTEYVSEHRPRLPAVAAARLGRTWDLFRPDDVRRYAVGEGATPAWQRAAQIIHWVLLPFVVVGVVGALRTSRRHRWAPVLALPILVSITAMATYGSPRFRSAAEPAIAVLAAAGLRWLWGRARLGQLARTTRSSTEAARTPASTVV